MTAQDAGQVRIVGRSADDDFLGARFDVTVVAGFAVGGPLTENAGAFQNDVDAQVAPRQLGRVAFGHRLDLLAVDGQIFVVVADFAGETAVDAVVLQQGRQRFVVGQVVDAHDLKLFGLRHQATKNEPTDSTKTIDTNTNCHN